MDTIAHSSALTHQNPWVVISMLIFGLLILYFLFKFFAVFFEFIQAKGCLTAGLAAMVGLPGIFVLTLLTGYNITSSILILLAVIGVITGYIARDAEGNASKSGTFIMIVSIITLVLAVFLGKILHYF